MTHVGLSPVFITKGFLFERSAELGVSGDTEKMFSSTDVHIPTHTYIPVLEGDLLPHLPHGGLGIESLSGSLKLKRVC